MVVVFMVVVVVFVAVYLVQGVRQDVFSQKIVRPIVQKSIIPEKLFSLALSKMKPAISLTDEPKSA